MLKWLLKSVLILIVLVVASAILPLASFWLCRDPLGGQVFFWVAPWTCAFWSILAYNLIGSKFWRGREAVKEWRAQGPRTRHYWNTSIFRGRNRLASGRARLQLVSVFAFLLRCSHGLGG